MDVEKSPVEADLKEDVMAVSALTFAFVAPFVMKAAVKLDIPDIIARAGNGVGLTVGEIAAQISGSSIQIDVLERVMKFLVANNVFKETLVEGPSGKREIGYGLTKISKWLVREDNPVCFAPMLLFQTDEAAQAPWHHLHEVVAEGGYAFDRAHGKDVWELAREDATFNRLINGAMAASSNATMALVLRNYHGFEGVKKLVDVGGGTGRSISAIVAAYPHIQGINYDLPHVVATAPNTPGVQHVGGSMFESVPAADAAFMKAVLHDWDDERCKIILKNCYEALPKDGKLIIVDSVLAKDENGVNAAASASLDMVMVAHASGGKERTEQEWKSLLSESRFSGISFVQTESLLSVIEAYKSN